MIEVIDDGPLWTVRLNRPEKANALTAEMLHGLVEAFEKARGNAHAIVLTGAGRVFSAGADLKAARSGLATDPVWERLSRAIVEQPGLTIAALNGTVAGGAFGMVLACDLRIAVPDAVFFYPVMKLGFLPQPSDPGRLDALVGAARTKLILMAGARITAGDARLFGLLDEVVEGDDLLPHARKLAKDACAAAPEYLVAIKAMCPS